jgi:integrase
MVKFQTKGPYFIDTLPTGSKYYPKLLDNIKDRYSIEVKEIIMSPASLANQIDYVLTALFWDTEAIKTYKAVHQVASVKRDLRPNGNPIRPLPAILSYLTRSSYFERAITFFQRAKALTGKRLLVDLLNPEIVRNTLDTHYREHKGSSLRTLLAAIGKVHQGCGKVGWTEAPSPITDELRAHVKTFRDDGDVRQARFGYIPEDAERIIATLKAKGSAYALAAQIVLRCGLRNSEVAGLKGENVDLENMVLRITGKGGRNREVDLPPEIGVQLNPSQQYLFNPNRSWKESFSRAVRKTARELGITVSGVHRLRANCLQNTYQKLTMEGLTDREARKKISQDAGHNRVNVTYSYVPEMEGKSTRLTAAHIDAILARQKSS